MSERERRVSKAKNLDSTRKDQKVVSRAGKWAAEEKENRRKGDKFNMYTIQ